MVVGENAFILQIPRTSGCVDWPR